MGGRCRHRLARTASGRGTRAGDASCLSVRAHQPLAARLLTRPQAAQPHAFHLCGWIPGRPGTLRGAHTRRRSAPFAAAAWAPDPSGRPAPLWAYVREAIADGIGIRPTDVDPAREFASYGVDSIGAMRIMQTIQARYGDHIPMAAILEHPSVDRLAAHLGRSYVLPDEIPDTAAPILPDTTTTARGAAPRLTAQPVWIPFTEAETGVPAYCLFGDTGELTWLLHLSEGLAAAGPVLGLEAPGFGDHAEPLREIADLARFSADAVLARHGEGPCRVVGHGLCGFVAAETARLLLDAGVDVAELLLLGTPEPGLVPAPESAAASVTAVADTLAAVWGAGARPAIDAAVPASTSKPARRQRHGCWSRTRPCPRRRCADGCRTRSDGAGPWPTRPRGTGRARSRASAGRR